MEFVDVNIGFNIGSSLKSHGSFSLMDYLFDY